MADDHLTNIYFTGESGNPFYRDLFNLPVSVGSGIITKVVVYCRWWRIFKDTTGYISVKPTDTVYESAGLTIESGHPTFPWQTYSNEWVTNPDDGEAWEWSDIDALQIGTKQQSWWLAFNNYGTARCTQIYLEVHYDGAIEILRPDAPGDETNYSSQYPDSGYHWDKVDENGIFVPKVMII